eukprot:SAG31_NODE_3887_length_3780_cov_8.208639_4_plen_97_part_00
MCLRHCMGFSPAFGSVLTNGTVLHCPCITSPPCVECVFDTHVETSDPFLDGIADHVASAKFRSYSPRVQSSSTFFKKIALYYGTICNTNSEEGSQK